MMDATGVKELLSRVHECREDYTLSFSGKKSGKENGHYRPGVRKIVIHDGNFLSDAGALNEHLLLYTAIHELAHHVTCTEAGQNGPRAHTKLFWAVFHDLLEAAEAAGVYRVEVDGEVGELVAEARRISAEIAALERKLGEVIMKIAEACERKGLRAEDVIERKAQLSRKTMDNCVKARKLNLPEGTVMDVQRAAVRERDEYRRALITRGGMKGKSVAQLKRPPGPPREKNEESRLRGEKDRLEHAIARLSARLREITEKLKRLEGETA
jgi:hypothetical protein